MGTVRKTITLTDLRDRWIKAQIAVLRSRSRRIRSRMYPSDKTVSSIMEEVEARLHSGGRRPRAATKLGGTS